MYFANSQHNSHFYPNNSKIKYRSTTAPNSSNHFTTTKNQNNSPLLQIIIQTAHGLHTHLKLFTNANQDGVCECGSQSPTQTDLYQFINRLLVESSTRRDVSRSLALRSPHLSAQPPPSTLPLFLSVTVNMRRTIRFRGQLRLERILLNPTNRI